MGKHSNGQQAVRALVWAILQPLHRNNLYTRDMHPWGEQIAVAQGPTTMTVAVQLARPEADLVKALKMGAAMEQYIARVFRLAPGQSVPVRVSGSGQYLLVEVPKLEAAWRPTYLELADRVEGAVLVGLDGYGQPVALDPEAVVPGMKVVGMSGSGKSTAMRLIAAQAAWRGWQLWIADTKWGESWQDFRPLAPGRFALTTEEQASLITRLTVEMDARNQGTRPKEPPILLVFDEMIHAEKPIKEALVKLVAQGRSARIRFLFGAQRWGDEAPKGIRANITWGLVGLVESAQASTFATNITGAGADKLQGKGDMLLVEDGREARRVQVARADAGDIAELLGEAIRRQAGTLAAEAATAPLDLPPLSAAAIEARFAEEAARAADGRVVPTGALIGRANEYAIRNERPAPYRLLRAWARLHMGRELSKKRLDELRDAAAIVERAWREGFYDVPCVPGVPGGEGAVSRPVAAYLRPRNGQNGPEQARTEAR